MRFRRSIFVFCALFAGAASAATDDRCQSALGDIPIEWSPGPASLRGGRWVQATEITVDGDPSGLMIFQLHAEALFRALAHAEGCVAYASAQVRGTTTFRTVSVWESRDAMRAYVDGTKHAGARRATERRQAAPARFAAWQAEARPTGWAEVAAALDGGRKPSP